ncbi:hypothetical protein QF030_001339 [Streptomyces rishiriensis]|uniref:Tn3 transposase DDE domain-containing protein n=1 Tax=Streptomyces rishiriensis TaxID=68264 RepID=A0ABU0NJ80_STRRH|nr:hypothetical protein [Streptomyces rishiriensis]
MGRPPSESDRPAAANEARYRARAHTVLRSSYYGKDGDLTGSDKESQEASMLALRLLQSALGHMNTPLLQDNLRGEKWQERLTDADGRALSPLFRTHLNPYGWFEPDMNSRLDLDLSIRTTTLPGPSSRRERQPQPRHDTSGPWPGRIPRGLGRVHVKRAPPSPRRFGWCRPGGQLWCSRVGMSPRVARRSVRCLARVGGLRVAGRRGLIDVVVGRGPAGQQVQGVLRG